MYRLSKNDSLVIVMKVQYDFVGDADHSILYRNYHTPCRDDLDRIFKQLK